MKLQIQLLAQDENAVLVYHSFEILVTHILSRE